MFIPIDSIVLDYSKTRKWIKKNYGPQYLQTNNIVELLDDIFDGTFEENNQFDREFSETATKLVDFADITTQTGIEAKYPDDSLFIIQGSCYSYQQVQYLP